jgi:uncharacterized protein
LVITERDGAVRITIYVQPRASRTEVAGEHGDAIKLRVAAPPVDGEANLEVRRFLARLFGVPASAVELVAGESSRRKTIEVAGIDAATARAKLLP